MNETPFKKSIFAAVTAVVAVVISIVAFKTVVRPFDVPEFQEIDTSDSAFLIPLEGDATRQQMFPSIEFLNEQKVAAKRVAIPHRWQTTGFLPGNGKYVPVVRLIKIDRKPVTREWTRQRMTGTSNKDEAVAAESKDSINFTMGAACTANIPEDLAATFLYTYPSSSLADVMDTEIRARVQQVIAEEAARFPFAEMLGKKVEMMEAVRADVIPYFEKRGIKVSTLGMLGGLQFENAEIQKSIDDAIKSQQQKIISEAKRAAQEVENQRIKMEAQAMADAEIMKAETQSKLKKQLAQQDADAEAIRTESIVRSRLKIADAEVESLKRQSEAKLFEAKQAMEDGSIDALVKLRQIEMEASRWKLWDGKIPASPIWPPMAALNPMMAIGWEAKK